MSDPSSTAGLSSKYLGRRLRPWWGQRPSRLVIRGLIGLVLFGVLAVTVLRFATDSAEVADLAESVDWPNGRVRLLALVGSGLLGLAALHGLVSFVVGIVDVVSRRTVEGTIVSARRRHPGDWMPKPVQMVLRFRRRRRHGHHHDLDHERRVRHEIVVDTGSGQKAWNTEPRRFDAGLQNRRVRLTVTPLIGYVREIEALDPAPGAAAAPLAGAHAGADPTGATPSHGEPARPGAPAGVPTGTPDPNADVLSQIPGYEKYRGSGNRVPGLDQLQQIPGMRGILDRIPGIENIPGLGGSGTPGVPGRSGVPGAGGSGDLGDLADAPPVSPPHPAPHPTPPVPGDPRPPMPPGPPGPPPAPGPVPPPVPGPPPTPQPPVPPAPPAPQPPPLPPVPEPGPDPAAPGGDPSPGVGSD